MRRHLAGRVSRNAVEHDRECGPALAGRAQELPGNGIRVAGGGRDEEPAVRGGEQLVRERPVLRQHRVDVRRVEQREPRWQRRRGDELERSRRTRPAGDPRQAGQDAIALERSHVIRVTGEHGRPVVGRGTPAGLTMLPTRLLTSVDFPAPVEPPTTISAGVELPQARQQVVVDLRDEIVTGAAGVVGARDVELEPNRAKIVAEPLERLDQVGGHGSDLPAQRRAEACAAE